ncbi:MAG: hypothetical protein K0Q94_2604 [Paenibacillus sp.]|jgi:hypothetical protein|nr:hypothetical protein [Paenibacillus sp.]
MEPTGASDTARFLRRAGVRVCRKTVWGKSHSRTVITGLRLVRSDAEIRFARIYAAVHARREPLMGTGRPDKGGLYPVFCPKPAWSGK